MFYLDCSPLLLVSFQYIYIHILIFRESSILDIHISFLPSLIWTWFMFPLLYHMHYKQYMIILVYYMYGIMFVSSIIRIILIIFIILLVVSFTKSLNKCLKLYIIYTYTYIYKWLKHELKQLVFLSLLSIWMLKSLHSTPRAWQWS